MIYDEIDDRILKYVPKSKHKAIRAAWQDSDGYWITLKDGYNAGRMDNSGCHTIHEDTISDLRYQIAGIEVDERYWEDKQMPGNNATESIIFSSTKGDGLMVEIIEQERFTALMRIVSGSDKEYAVALNPSFDSESGQFSSRVTSVFDTFEGAENAFGTYELAQRNRHYNTICREITSFIEATRYDTNYYDLSDACAKCFDNFTAEDIKTALALYIKQHDWDGRIDNKNKEWAKEQLEGTRDNDIYGFAVDMAHPAVMQGFINELRTQLRLREESKSVSLDTNSFILKANGQEYNLSDGFVYLYSNAVKPLEYDYEAKMYIQRLAQSNRISVSYQDSFSDEPEINYYDVNNDADVLFLGLKLDNFAKKATKLEVYEIPYEKGVLFDCLNAWTFRAHRQFLSGSELDDLSRIPIAFTTDPDTDWPIQVYADLNERRLITEYCNIVVNDKRFESDEDMGDYLSCCEFDNIIALTDEMKSKVETRERLYGEKTIEDSEVKGLVFTMYDDGSGYADYNGEEIGDVDYATNEYKVGGRDWDVLSTGAPDDVVIDFKEACRKYVVSKYGAERVKADDEIILPTQTESRK